MMSIGKPMPGVSVLVVDEKNNEIGIGQKGELCVSGAQLTPGYWENPTKNEESFFNIEIEGISTRFYKTGDSCYIDEDYDLMLSGRIDHQVKIQGYRIELGEIEYHAREYLSGQNAVACDYPNHIGNSEIALFIEGTLTDKNKLISYLGKKMPYYMMPTKIITEKIFPINTSGKVDRMLLKNKVLQ